MFLKIKHIILYPRNKDFKPRVIRFEENKVNVITGYSQRGKSAITYIIDYCLGSSECNIPIGKIRNYVDKFALNINLGDKFLFIARDCPEDINRTNMYYEIYPDEQNMSFKFDHWISDADKFKTNRDDIKNFLGELAGFKSISEKDIDTSLSSFDGPASFRDTTAFQFQPQNIIANPTTIFYNTDSFEHLKRLKTLFPLVLGYKSYEILKIEREIDSLEKNEKEKQKRYEDIRFQYENWQSDIYKYYSTAISLGLTSADIDITTSTVNQLKEELTAIVSSIQQRDYFKEGSSLRYSQKLEELDAIRMKEMRKLDELKVDLLKIEKFDKAKETYIIEVAAEIDNRLRPIDWFIQQKGTNICPFCNSNTSRAIDELLYFKDQQVENKMIINQAISKEFSFEKEKLKLRADIVSTEKSIKGLQANIDILIVENKQYYDKYQDIFEFAGKIAHVIENLEKISPSGELLLELKQLQGDIAQKKVTLYNLKQKFDKTSCLKRVTEAIGYYVKILPIEDRTNQLVRLDPDNSVSIRIENIQTKNITFLSKLGSGANHMLFHLATMLGLHEYFLKLPESGKINYVPSFLVLDQPSQVYFPEGFPESTEPDETTVQAKYGDDTTGDTLGSKEKKKKKTSEDISNTTSIFSACSQFLVRNNFQTQIIILEHAPESTWKGVDNVFLVEEWRGGITDEGDNDDFNALIQKDWLDA